MFKADFLQFEFSDRKKMNWIKILLVSSTYKGYKEVIVYLRNKEVLKRFHM